MSGPSSWRRSRGPTRPRSRPCATRSRTRATPTTRRGARQVRDARRRAAPPASRLGEPILDLVRRILDTTGIDVELASSVSPAAAARRENLDLFVQAVAEFQAVDGEVTLAALLAWLEAEDEFGQGLDVATPSEADSVKLLTVHRAKGLEWDVVFLVGVTQNKFPTNRGRSSWLTLPSVMPTALRGDARDLPQLGGHTAADINALKEAAKAHEAREELRLGYVAWTRAKQRLYASAWRWASHLKGGLGPSDYLLRTREAMAEWGGEPDAWLDSVAKADVSPYAQRSTDLTWPISHHTAEVERRHDAAARLAAVDVSAPDDLEDMLLLERVQQWDDEIARLLEEAVASGHPTSPYPCRRACPPPRSPGCATTRSPSPATSPGRCRGRRRPPRASAPASMPGWRRGSASSCCSTPTTSPAVATPTSTTTPISRSW